MVVNKYLLALVVHELNGPTERFEGETIALER